MWMIFKSKHIEQLNLYTWTLLFFLLKVFVSTNWKKILHRKQLKQICQLSKFDIWKTSYILFLGLYKIRYLFKSQNLKDVRFAAPLAVRMHSSLFKSLHHRIKNFLYENEAVVLCLPKAPHYMENEFKQL